MQSHGEAREGVGGTARRGARGGVGEEKGRSKRRSREEQEEEQGRSKRRSREGAR